MSPLPSIMAAAVVALLSIRGQPLFGAAAAAVHSAPLAERHLSEATAVLLALQAAALLVHNPEAAAVAHTPAHLLALVAQAKPSSQYSRRKERACQSLL